MEERITVHEKARGETINVYIGEYRGTKYLHIREWYLDKDQEEKPTKKGVALPVENRRGALRLRALTGPAPFRTLALVWRRGTPLAATMRALGTTLAQAYAALVPRLDRAL